MFSATHGLAYRHRGLAGANSGRVNMMRGHHLVVLFPRQDGILLHGPRRALGDAVSCVHLQRGALAQPMSFDPQRP